MRWFGTNVDVSEQVRIGEELAEAVRAKDILLHEVNHRVKNSLQLVTSLLMLHARRASDPALKQALMEARGRIGVVAAMHQRLYSTSQHDRVNFGEYLRELAEEALASTGGDSAVSLQSRVEDGLVVPLSLAVPLALVVSELITNAVKYAFPNGYGELRVELSRRDDNLIIGVADNGIGLPGGFDPARSDGLGMKIVTSLVRQVGGELQLHAGSPGTCFQVVVPDFLAPAGSESGQ